MGCLPGTFVPGKGMPIPPPKPPRKVVYLQIDGERRSLKSRKPTIAAVLKEARVDLDPLDEVQPPLLSPVYERTVIVVTRVVVREVTVEEKIPYRTKIARTGGRWQRHPIVKAPGRPGRALVRYRVTLRAGVPIRRERISARVIEPSVPQVVQVQPYRRLASRGVYAGRRVLRMVATAYDPGPLSCGSSADGRTAIGMKVRHGIVAVDPAHIPLRTRLFIPGYGYAIAADVGSAIKGNRIDLFYASRTAALRFGRRPVTVYVMD
jgi:3D (Asp-Asp-Asp) domain-containing protein